MQPAIPRDARAEARAVVGPEHDVRVLEPSPPAVHDEWFADDPAAAPTDGRPVIAPVPGTDRSWSELVAERPDLRTFAVDRWLGPWRRLEVLPPAFSATRDELHRLAAHVVSPAREVANGKIGLRSTFRGFGTPFFGEDEQIRVEGTDLVHERAGVAQRAPITSLRAAAALVGVELDASRAERGDVPELGDPDAPLQIDAEAAAALADWYGFAASVLEELRATDGVGRSPSRVQLWPEHFDPAVELGDEAAGTRAGFGASAGDGWHATPYLYVSVWARDRLAGDLADVEAFDAPFGAHLGYEDLLAAPDQRAAALAMFRAALAALEV